MEDVEREDKKISPLIIDFVFSFLTSLFEKTSGVYALGVFIMFADGVLIMDIRNVNIKELKPYEKNPRRNDEAVKFVASSIKEFGFKVPIIVDKDMVIIAGHTRYKAAKKLKLKEVPVIMADDLTDEQVKAFRLADNRVAERSEWDFDLLTDELTDILDIDMEQFGFEFDGGVEDEVQEDDFEIEPPKEPKAKIGDIYQLGRHRLMCGDSTKVEDVDKLMNGNVADMLFTDPPYGYCYQSNMRTKTEKFDVLKNDDKILDFMGNVKKYVSGFVFVCTTWKVLDKWLPVFTEYYDLTNMIIWNKGGGGIGDLTHTFSTDYEIILCSNNGKPLIGKRIGSVWDIKKDNASEYVHATQKPVELAAQAIKSTTVKNDDILDVFGGSGSTLLACEQLGRTCYTMELDPCYVDVIIQRWEEFTGGEAKLINEV